MCLGEGKQNLKTLREFPPAPSKQANSLHASGIVIPCCAVCCRFQLENETSFTTKKGRSVDNSIARAYTAAIRRARRFIYVENQYFMGSAYGWLDDQDVHCYNVIPMEITQKICESIDAGRR